MLKKSEKYIILWQGLNIIQQKKMFEKLQQLKGRTKLKSYEDISNYYDKLNIRMDEDPFAKNAQGIAKFYHEVFLLIKFLQTKPELYSKNTISYDL